MIAIIRIAVVLATLLLTACHAGEEPVRMYVLDCGTLKSANPAPLQERGVTTTDMSVAAYVVVHPRGTLMWDTGVILDEMIQSGTTTSFRATAMKPIETQLAWAGGPSARPVSAERVMNDAS